MSLTSASSRGAYNTGPSKHGLQAVNHCMLGNRVENPRLLVSRRASSGKSREARRVFGLCPERRRWLSIPSKTCSFTCERERAVEKIRYRGRIEPDDPVWRRCFPSRPRWGDMLCMPSCQVACQQPVNSLSTASSLPTNSLEGATKAADATSRERIRRCQDTLVCPDSPPRIRRACAIGTYVHVHNIAVSISPSAEPSCKPATRKPIRPTVGPVSAWLVAVAYQVPHQQQGVFRWRR